MTRSRTVTALAASLVIVLLSAAPALADQLYVLGLQDIEGDSSVPVDVGKKGIDILSFSWGVTNPVSFTATSLSAGKPAFTDFSVVLFGGREVPELVLRTAAGTHIPKAKFIVYENTGGVLVKRYEIEFTNVFVTAFQSAGSSGDRIVHYLSFAYGKIIIRTFTQAEDGTMTTEERGWNIVEQKKQ